MPKIDTYTAQTGPGVIPAVTTSPNSFGAQAFASIGELGKGFQEIAAKAQHAQDQTDLVKLASDYDVQLDQAKTQIAQHPDLERHGEMLQEVTDKLRANLLKANPGVSSAVQTAFENHAVKQDSAAAIDLAHAGVTVKVQRALADFTATQDALTQRAASAPTLEEADRHLVMLDDLRNNMVRQGLLSPQDGLKYKESATDRY